MGISVTFLPVVSFNNLIQFRLIDFTSIAREIAGFIVTPDLTVWQIFHGIAKFFQFDSVRGNSAPMDICVAKSGITPLSLKRTSRGT